MFNQITRTHYHASMAVFYYTELGKVRVRYRDTKIWHASECPNDLSRVTPCRFTLRSYFLLSNCSAVRRAGTEACRYMKQQQWKRSVEAQLGHTGTKHRPFHVLLRVICHRNRCRKIRMASDRSMTIPFAF